jgi:prepilin-type N-terminal cleavage/methylation domain-containing protein
MRNERGFTLVELVIVVALTGIIASVIGSAIFQLSTVSGYGEARLTAMHELQNAGYWLNRDGQMSASASGGASLSLSIPSAPGVTYTLVGTNLRRYDGTSTIVMAKNISSASFSVSGRVITMTITSAPPGRDQVSQQGTYSVAMRPVP